MSTTALTRTEVAELVAEVCQLRDDVAKLRAPEQTNGYPPLQVVEWVDATNIATWERLDGIEKWATGDGFLCRNVGYLVYEDDDCVVLAARFSPDGKATSVGLFERLPKGMIVARWTLPDGPVSS